MKAMILFLFPIILFSSTLKKQYETGETYQFAEKDKQLDQQQQLTAKALTEREQTLLELEQEKSKGFFAKLFRK